MNKLKIAVVVTGMVALEVVSFWTYAACVNNINATTPDSRYAVHDDETVTDTETGLMWRICSVGQNTTVLSCDTGIVETYTWQEALQFSESFNQSGGFAGYTDWRLPNRNELASLVERRCSDPSINENVFPYTAVLGYWTSSPFSQNASYAWLVRFNAGPIYPTNKTESWAVRLVRNVSK